MAKVILESDEKVDAALFDGVKNCNGTLDARRETWMRLSVENRRIWLHSGRDKALTALHALYEGLQEFFEDLDE